MIPTEKYQQLVKWMVDNEISFSSSLGVKEKGNGIGVFAQKRIPNDSILLSVSKEVVLSPVTSGIANLLEDFEDLGTQGMIALTVSYMFEKAQGPDSPWHEFLETIPVPDSNSVLLPKFWRKHEQEWLKGTEIEFMGGLDHSEVSDVYKNLVQPFIAKHKELFASKPEYLTYEGYRDSLMAVCCRAFDVDEFRGLSLVPGACLFNHSDQEDVHFESNGAVCRACGDANYCEHMAYSEIASAEEAGELNRTDDEYEDVDEDTDEDIDEGQIKDLGVGDVEVVPVLVGEMVDSCHITNAEKSSNNSDEEEEEQQEEEEDTDTCEIRTLHNIKIGQEIFNSYGQYSNGVLLSRYGFAIWDNMHETVGLGPEILQYAKEKDLKARTKWWSKSFYMCLFGIRHEEYYNLEESPEHELPPSPDSVSWGETVEIDSAGNISEGLAMAADLLCMSPKKFLLAQTRVSKGKPLDTGSSNSKHASLIKELILRRLKRYQESMTSKEYKNMLHGLENKKEHDVTKQRQALAFTVRGTEKLVLERALERLK